MKDLSIDILANNSFNKYKIAEKEGNFTKAFSFIREAYILNSNNQEIINAYFKLSLYFNYIENAKMLSKKISKMHDTKGVNNSFIKEREFLSPKVICEYENNLEKCFLAMDKGKYDVAYSIIREIRKNIEKILVVIELLLIEALILITTKNFNGARILLKEVLEKDKGNIKAKEYLSFINEFNGGEG